MPNIAIEIGGTKLQLFAGDDSEKIIERVQLPVQAKAGAAGIRGQIEEHLSPLARRHGARAIGVGFGGPVDWQQGKIRASHQVEGWSGFDLGGWLRELTGLPVAVDNDANVAAFGEARKGAGRGHDPVFYATLGSGVGGGLVVDGAIYHGAAPGEAELGHIRLDPSGVTVEERCSGWALDKRIRGAAVNAPRSLLARLAAADPGAEARHLATALAKEDSLAKTILDELATDLGFALSHVSHLFHPQVIVLGGGLSKVGEPLRRAVAQKLLSFTMKAFLPGPQLMLSALGEDAVPAGALQLARSAR